MGDSEALVSRIALQCPKHCGRVGRQSFAGADQSDQPDDEAERTQRRERRPSRSSIPRSVSQVRARRPNAIVILISFIGDNLEALLLRSDGACMPTGGWPASSDRLFWADLFIRRTHRTFRDDGHELSDFGQLGQ